MLLIPAIDLHGGRCVRLQQGDFAAEIRYATTAQELRRRYQALGASWLHVVDLDGAAETSASNRATILALATAGAPRLQVGGGLRSAQSIQELLDAGAERAVLGSTAIERPAEALAWLGRFGVERICLAFDVRIDSRGEPVVQTRGWRNSSGLTLWEALGRFPAGSVRHVLCTDVGRDGMLSGPNLALYHQALARFPQLSWQASGGVRDARDLAALAHAGVVAAVSGRALLEESIDIEELRPYLPGASFPVSTYATARW
jgi:phosphoribosylformimino-5-aminoimidazole carboxamide ribotide isomerase